jgi:RNA polymerase sigma factor (sigma-70 family)
VSGAVTFSWTLPPGPPLTAEQQRLVVEALPMADLVVRRFNRGWPIAQQYTDDLQSVAYEGLIRAAQHFRPGLNAWRSYAYGGAYMQCRAWLQAMRLRAMESLDAPLEDGFSTAWLERHAAPTESPEAYALQRQVLALAKELPVRQRVAVLRHLDGSTLEDVAEELECTRAAVHVWEVSALTAIRTRLGLPERSRAKKKAAPVDGQNKLLAVLADGTPRTVQELVTLTGYSRQGLGTALRAIGAVPAGFVPRGRSRASLWTLPT